MFTNQIGLFGILPLLLPEYAHLISDYCVGWGFGLCTCFISLFAIHLFRLPAGSWSRRFFLVTFLLGCLTILSVPLDRYGTFATIMLFGLFALMIMMVWLSIRAIRRREPVR